VQAYHRVVGRQAQLERYLADLGALDDDTSQKERVLGLQVLSLGEDTPAVDAVVLLGRGELDLVERECHFASLAQLVDHQVTHDLPDPSVDPTEVPQLVRLREGPLERPLQHVLRVHPGAGALTHQGEQRPSLRP
jgi:hypothetical protein